MTLVLAQAGIIRNPKLRHKVVSRWRMITYIDMVRYLIRYVHRAVVLLINKPLHHLFAMSQLQWRAYFCLEPLRSGGRAVW